LYRKLKWLYNIKSWLTSIKWSQENSALSLRLMTDAIAQALASAAAYVSQLPEVEDPNRIEDTEGEPLLECLLDQVDPAPFFQGRNMCFFWGGK
jgi:hypothetical protein